MSNNKERDARRALDEARELLDHRPEPYVARPRAIGERDPLESSEPEAELDEPAAPERRQQPQHTAATDWAPWEEWIQARIQAALIVERQAIAEIMAHALAQCMTRERAAAQRELHAQVAELKRETAKLEHAMRHLSELIQLEKTRSLDLPALPRHDLN